MDRLSGISYLHLPSGSILHPVLFHIVLMSRPLLFIILANERFPNMFLRKIGSLILPAPRSPMNRYLLESSNDLLIASISSSVTDPSCLLCGDLPASSTSLSTSDGFRTRLTFMAPVIIQSSVVTSGFVLYL